MRTSAPACAHRSLNAKVDSDHQVEGAAPEEVADESNNRWEGLFDSQLSTSPSKRHDAIVLTLQHRSRLRLPHVHGGGGDFGRRHPQQSTLLRVTLRTVVSEAACEKLPGPLPTWWPTYRSSVRH